MGSQSYHLAEINIARMLAPLDDPIMAEFVANLVAINTLAEKSPGFVWRLQTEEGDATSLRIFDDEKIIINMSVWESVEALFQFAYNTQHTDFFRRRKEWFEKMDTPVLVMWWVPAGHNPTLAEAKEKLELLEKHGPTPLAFTFKQRFSVGEMLQHGQALVAKAESRLA
jgi:hypothetical protein